MLYFSSGGQYAPPFLVFPTQRMKYGILDGAPFFSGGILSSKRMDGWMDGWMEGWKQIFC
jgi:hypothetical protein